MKDKILPRWLFCFKIIPKALLTAIIGACSVHEKSPIIAPISLPDALHSSYPVDSVHTGTISWRNYFLDTILVRHIEEALQVNADLIQAVARVSQSKAQYLAATGALMPSLQVRGRAGGERFGKYTMNGVGNFDTNLSDRISDEQRVNENFTPDFFLAFESSWELDIWGKLRQSRKARQLEILASEEGIHLIKTIIVSTIAELYFTLQALDDKKEIIENELKLQKEGLEKTKILKASGRTTELAVKQFEAQILNTEALLRKVLIDINIVENAINTIKMQPPGPVRRNQELFNPSMDSAIVLSSPILLLFNRPDIRQSENLLRAAGADLTAARLAFFPQLTVNPFIGLNAFKSSLFFNPASLAFAAFGTGILPVFQQNQLKANYRFQLARLRQAQAEYQKSIVHALNEVNSSLVSFEEYLKISKLKEEETTTLKISESVANELFLNGYVTYLDLLTVRREVLKTQLEHVEATLNRKIARVRLYRSLGGGWF